MLFGLLLQKIDTKNFEKSPNLATLRYQPFYLYKIVGTKFFHFQCFFRLPISFLLPVSTIVVVVKFVAQLVERSLPIPVPIL